DSGDSALAAGAEEAGALADDAAPDQIAAAAAGLALASVHEQLLLEVAGLAVRAGEVAQRGTTAHDGLLQHLAHVLCQARVLGAADAAGGACRADAGAEQGLGGVDVSRAH